MYNSHPYQRHSSDYLKIASSTDSFVDLLMRFTIQLFWIIKEDSL